MISYRRPDKPHGFPPEKIQRAEAALRAAGGAGVSDCPDHWKDYKSNFYGAQRHKCAWCEALDTTEPGAVDHYRPKAEVGRLESPGHEVDHGTNVRDRCVGKVHSPGYWQLAYDWDNWLFVCNRCNSGWKRTLFPVAEEPHPHPDGRCTPLLLNPYDDGDPIDHLDFSDIGQIEALNDSPRGRATIETCGLDRETLRSARAQIVTQVRTWMDVIDLAGTTEQREVALRGLRDLAHDGAPFAGAARAVIRRELGVSWSELARR